MQEVTRITHNRLWQSLDSLTDTNRWSLSDNHQRGNPVGLLRILHHNAHSLLPKLYYYESLNLFNTCEIISINETWLKNSIPDNNVSLPGFHLVRADRDSNNTKKSRGGGAALYVKQNIQFTHLHNISSALQHLCESVWISVNSNSPEKSLIIGSIYLPPDSDKLLFLEKMTSILSSRKFTNKKLLLVGDFNVNWNCQSLIKDEFVSFAHTFNLVQPVTGTTYISHQGNESLLDLNFVSQSLSVNRCKILTCDKTLSDHYATHLTLQFPSQTHERKIITTRSYKNIDLDRLYLDVSSHQLDNMSLNPNFSVNQKALCIEECIITSLDKQSPVKQIRVRKPQAVWLTDKLKKLIRLKNKCYKKTYHNSSPCTQDQVKHYHRFKNFVTNEIRRTKRNFFVTQLTTDSRSFYKCLRNLRGKNSCQEPVKELHIDGRTLLEPHCIVDAINDYFLNISSHPQTKPAAHTKSDTRTSMPRFQFSPVSSDHIISVLSSLKPTKRGGRSEIPTYIYQYLSGALALPLANIFNQSLIKTEFPECYKIALVTPIYKKGDRTDPSNYRPISSLPILSKVFEKILHQQLIDHLENQNLLNSRQFGFRKNHSSEQLILSLLHSWRIMLDKSSPCYIAALSMDIRKAFDSVDHSILLTKLPTFNLSPSCISLLESYLKDRCQVMKIGNTFSSPGMVRSGVPQGSVLGPLLFNIMVNDLLHTFPSSFAYADDTILYTSAPTPDEAIHKASELLDSTLNWYKSNNFTVNLSKTALCVFTNRQSLPTTSKITNADTVIHCQNNLTLLGVTLDPKLLFSQHIRKITAKASQVLYLLSRLRQYLNMDQLKTAYQSLVRPILEYCPSLLLSITNQLSLQLERVQNNAIRIILRTNRLFSITSGRHKLNLPTLKSRRLLLFHKFAHSKLLKEKASPFLLQIIQNMSTHTRSLRATKCQTNVIKPYFRTKFGKGDILQLLYTALTTKPRLTYALTN